jgi:hypothetical protein
MKRKNQHTDHTTQQWQALADKYFEGLTTDEEESLLRRFVTSEEGSGEAFDELRAVMGFLAVGRHEHKAATTLRRPARRYWAAAAVALVLLASGATWMGIRQTSQNVCVAYIDGQKCTDDDVVMQQMHASMANVQHQPSDVTVDDQLSDMFHTLDEGTADTQK